MLARLKRRIFQHYRFLRVVLVAFIIGVLIYITSSFIFPFFRLAKEVLFGPVNVFSVIFPRDQDLKNDNGRVNVLILGIGGEEHDGPNLTDTIIVVSATKSGTISLVSVPRDIYSDSLGGKINTAYALGLEKGPTVGLILAKATIAQVTGLPIHYAVRLDFSVFEKIIDLVGGIDVTVENILDDAQYPLDGKENDLCGGDIELKCRYETLYFDIGPAHLDGKTALKFVRSRHAQGDEGTDFARVRRQQLVIKALKEKVFSTQIFLNPEKDLLIYNELKSHLDTDFNPKETAKLFNLLLTFRQGGFKNIVLELDLLENPPIDQRGWILVPKTGNWDEVQNYIKSQLK